MTDIIERLRYEDSARVIKGVATEAADEIERLRAENEDLRRWKALDKPLTAAMGVASTTINQLKNEIERLRALLKECSDDLANEIEHRYRDTLDYPSQKNRYDLDMEPVEQARAALEGQTMKHSSWPDPTDEMLRTPEFEAIWQCIKSWDINVPSVYQGYCGANGNHVRAILDSLAALEGKP